MNSAHLHLLLVHIPVLFVPLATFLFIIAQRLKNNSISVTGLYLFLFSAIVAVVAYLLGEGAEENVEHALGVVKSAIEVHEEAAEVSLWFCVTLGLLSLAMLAALKFKPQKARLLIIPLVLISVLCSATLAYTAQQGGRIRHPEAFVASIESADKELGKHEDHDD